MGRFEEYVRRCCRAGGCTPEEVKALAVSREVERSYEAETGLEEPLHVEFVCCSES